MEETETEGEWGRGRETGDTESQAGSSLWAVSTAPDVGLKLMNCEIMTWAEVSRLTDWATQVPQNRHNLLNSFLHTEYQASESLIYTNWAT